MACGAALYLSWGKLKHLGRGETGLHPIPELLAADPFKPFFTEVYRLITGPFLLISFTPLIRQFHLYSLKHFSNLITFLFNLGYDVSDGSA